ncbi:MAG: terminase small subunit, partial [Acutalibacteraceae bacterium]
MSNELTAKERLFCLYYHLDRNAKEAAIKSGYGNNSRKALRLLRKKEVSDYIKKLDGENKTCTPEVAAGYRRLAFGCVSDAVMLLLDPEMSREELLKL